MIVTPGDVYISGVYAPPDERWAGVMDALASRARQRHRAMAVVGDLNVADPALTTPRNPRQAAFPAWLDDTNLRITEDLDPTLPSYIGDGTHCARIDLALTRSANQFEPISYAAWAPPVISDHALIVLELGNPASALPPAAKI
eukprot:gene2223-4562_t